MSAYRTPSLSHSTPGSSESPPNATPPSRATPAAFGAGEPHPSAASRKDELQLALANLRKEVDSLQADGWMFEGPRHTYR